MVQVQHVIEDISQEWRQSGIFDLIWTRLLKLYDKKKRIERDWQSLDSIYIKSPLGWLR
jgi:hypothetical protein